MVSRFFFLITLLSISLLNAYNILEDLKVEDGLLKLYFKNSLKRRDIETMVLSSKGLTKYIFDFKNSKQSSAVKHKYPLSGDIKSIRVSQFKKNTVRVVIDSKKPYRLRYFQKKDSVFKITLPKNSKITKNNIQDIVSTRSKSSSSEKRSPTALFESIGSGFYKSDEVNKNSKLYKKTGLRKEYKIIVDPGHGGKFVGAYRKGVKEKHIALQIGRKVYQKLKALGFKVIMTRYRDVHLDRNRARDLIKRIRKANRSHADVFVSIHANSIRSKRDDRKIEGIETYFLSKDKTNRAKRVASRENMGVLKSLDSTTKKVLLNAIFTGPKIVLSNKLAIDVQKNMLSRTRSRYKYVKDGGVKGGNIYVLVGAEMPAVLVEVGYLSNPKERARLLKRRYQDLIADGIVKGIVNFLKNREKELF